MLLLLRSKKVGVLSWQKKSNVSFRTENVACIISIIKEGFILGQICIFYWHYVKIKVLQQSESIVSSVDVSNREIY